MVAASTIKTFKIYNPETDTTIDIDMTILDYIKYVQMNELINAAPPSTITD